MPPKSSSDNKLAVRAQDVKIQKRFANTRERLSREVAFGEDIV